MHRHYLLTTSLGEICHEFILLQKYRKIGDQLHSSTGVIEKGKILQSMCKKRN